MMSCEATQRKVNKARLTGATPPCYSSSSKQAPFLQFARLLVFFFPFVSWRFRKDREVELRMIFFFSFHFLEFNTIQNKKKKLQE